MVLNKEQQNYIYKKLSILEQSKFRNSFQLRKYMYDYIDEKGLEIIEKHCIDFINKRLPALPNKHDGTQTPMKGHPVFIAQHATATCCRKCLFKWHNIPQTKELSSKEKKFIVALIMEWIKRKYNNR